jgi:acetyltransferase-like isoleucine patch superfamily enzyme
MLREKIEGAIQTPWKAWNEIFRWLVYPINRVNFAVNRIDWKAGWRLYGIPIILKSHKSRIIIGERMGLRSTLLSNPLGANHRVILCTWLPGAILEIGNDFGMTGGSICAASRISIGNRVCLGANSTIIDTDFHPVDPVERSYRPASGNVAPVVIEDDVFIGMNCLILKGVRLERGCMVGAGSVVTSHVPPGMIVAGNPARVIGPVR